MKVVVTGAMGFIGSNLVERLLSNGFSVVAIDDLSNPSMAPTDRIKRRVGAKSWERFQFFDYSLIPPNLSKIGNVCKDAEAMIHLAAWGSVPKSFANPMDYIVNNEVGFLVATEIAEKLEMKRFVYASSSSVYGDALGVIKFEGREGHPLSPYAATKASNEMFSRMWRPVSKLESIIGLRFFNVYGPGQRPDSPYSAVIPKFCNEETITVFGGEQIRDFTYVGDAVTAIMLGLETSQKFGIYNVGTGFGTKIKTVAEMVGKEIILKPARPGEIQTSVASTEKAIDELGFSAQVKFKDGLEATKAFYEENKP